ncbi:MAG: hypothetical protein EVA68_05295 [OM182 bacterium]|uniref:GTP cyclohydrolase I n=1 Tax=OM182 bacterium TaxID=2510334 RepID=A0A520S0U2_9GAMM|nr:MAG: hypothetical protein EVA68_05295 [OM182 bacterium]
MIMTNNIELYSLCEHLILPLIGKCHIEYIPRGKELGISKEARTADVFARKVQMQEILTKQIANAIRSVSSA